MGVRGLQKYIKERGFLCDYNLCDTKLIIDGPNLIHRLYEYHDIPVRFWGDYDSFARICEDFITTLRSFRVEPIVIFDGADDPSDIKLKTHKTRLLDRFNGVERICQAREHSLDNDQTSVLPLLAEMTFKQVLVKLGVEHACSLFEADWQIASLANKFGCPVLSGDTDFYVFDLAFGCIDISDLFKPLYKSTGLEYLQTKIYNSCCRRKLIKDLNMEVDEFVLPVLATLVGNDYFDSSDSQYKNPRKMIDIFSRNAFTASVSKNFVQFTIDWICRANFPSGKTAFEKLLEQVPNEQKSSFEKSVKTYCNVESKAGAFNVSDILGEIQRTDLARNNVPDLPRWFIQSLIKCDNNSKFLLNIVIHKRLIFKAQIENLQESPSFDCSKGIRQVIYGLLTGPELMTGIKEIHRYESNCTEVQPIRSLTNLALPCLADVKTLDSSSRKALLNAIFGNMVKDLPEEMEDTSKILILILSLWMRNSCAMEVHLMTFIISFLTIHIFNPDGPNVCGEILRARDNMERRSLDQFKSDMRQHLIRSMVGNFDIDILHKNAQFQSIYREMQFLNQLLLQPVCIPDPQNLLNGTLVCNVFHDLGQGANPETFLGGRTSPLFKLFDKWLKKVYQLKDCCIGI